VTQSPSDDILAAFQIEGQPLRGRIVRLGPAIHEILTRHDYPEPVANMLGEACALAALVGASLKFEGRLIVQAQGDGAISYVVADYDTTGALRGYCRFDPARVADLAGGFSRPGAKALLGEGVFLMTLDQGPRMDRSRARPSPCARRPISPVPNRPPRAYVWLWALSTRARVRAGAPAAS
jgi:molecular chaperone Hsp33